MPWTSRAFHAEDVAAFEAEDFKRSPLPCHVVLPTPGRRRTDRPSRWIARDRRLFSPPADGIKLAQSGGNTSIPRSPMSINSLSSTSTLNDLAAMIHRKLDKDQDGKLSADEFAGFLSSLLDGKKTAGVAGNGALTSDTFAATLNASASVASPAATATRTVMGTMGGFDPTKMADTEHKTFKYEIGRILQFFPNTPAGLKDALPEIQKLVPGAKIIGTNGDKIDFGEFEDNRKFRIGVIDVLQAAGAGGKSWQWLPVE
jgi:hypothetical protein